MQTIDFNENLVKTQNSITLTKMLPPETYYVYLLGSAREILRTLGKNLQTITPPTATKAKLAKRALLLVLSP